MPKWVNVGNERKRLNSASRLRRSRGGAVLRVEHGRGPSNWNWWRSMSLNPRSSCRRTYGWSGPPDKRGLLLEVARRLGTLDPVRVWQKDDN